MQTVQFGETNNTIPTKHTPERGERMHEMHPVEGSTHRFHVLSRNSPIDSAQWASLRRSIVVCIHSTWQWHTRTGEHDLAQSVRSEPSERCSRQRVAVATLAKGWRMVTVELCMSNGDGGTGTRKAPAAGWALRSSADRQSGEKTRPNSADV